MKKVFVCCLQHYVFNFYAVITLLQWLRLSRGERAGLWCTSSRVQTRQKPSDFSGEKILSASSFGGKVKPSAPCRKFTACKRTQKWRGNRHFRQNSRQFLAHSFTFRCWGSLASFQTLGTPCGESWNVLITGPPRWGFDVPLAKALCRNLPAEDTQR